MEDTFQKRYNDLSFAVGDFEYRRIIGVDELIINSTAEEGRRLEEDFAFDVWYLNATINVTYNNTDL